jgi:hypothetical protein
MQPDALEGWLAESFRLSFIGVPSWTPRPIFLETTGAQPALTTAQPLVQMHQEAGEVSHAQLSVVQQASRIDFVLGDKPRNPFDQTALDYKALFSIGPYREGLELFDSISAKAISLVSSAVRVAFSITLIRQTDNAQESIRCLHKLVPRLPVDPNNDLDLVFQINRPVHGSQGQLINRLAKWESLQITTVQVGVGAASLPIVPSRPPVSAAQVYIDVSTDAANISPLGNLSELVNELRRHATKLAEAGDT